MEPPLLLEIFAILVFLVFSFLSTQQVQRDYPNFFNAYLRTVGVYVLIMVVVECGYVFQGVSTNLSVPGKTYSGIKWVEFVVANSFAPINLLAGPIVSCVIALATLSKQDVDQRAIRASRCAFPVFTIGDIFCLLNSAAQPPDYLTCIGFNIFGAVITGAFAAFFANRILPAKFENLELIQD